MVAFRTLVLVQSNVAANFVDSTVFRRFIVDGADAVNGLSVLDSSSFDSVYSSSSVLSDILVAASSFSAALIMVAHDFRFSTFFQLLFSLCQFSSCRLI